MTIPTWDERLRDSQWLDYEGAMKAEIAALRAELKEAERILREVRLGKTPEDYGKDSVTIRRLQSLVQDYFDAAIKEQT